MGGLSPREWGRSNRDTVTTLENKRFPQFLNRDGAGGCHGLQIAGTPGKQGIVTVSRFVRVGHRTRRRSHFQSHDSFAAEL